MSSRAQAELAGADLRQHGAEPLPDRGGAGEHRHPPGVRHPHQPGLERPAAGALDAVREPDADMAALRARRRLPLREVVPARRLQHLRLAGRIIAAVVLHGGAGARLERLGVGHLLGRDQVAPPQLGALQLQFARDAVHQTLHREGGLRIAGAAHRRHRGLVGGGDRDLHRQRRQQIGPAHHRGRVVGDVDVLERIGAELVNEPAAHAQELAAGVDRDVDRPVLVALLRGVGEMLAPVLDPFDRAPDQLGGRHHRDVFRIDAELGTEAAADVGGRDPQPALVEIEQRGQRLEQVVRLLGRGPDRHPAVDTAALGDQAAAFDRMGGAAVLPELLVEDVRGLGEGGRGVAVGDLEGRDDVAVELAPHRRRVRRRRPGGSRRPPAAARSRPRPARRRPRRRSGRRRPRWRRSRRRRTPRRRRARTTTAGRAACPNWNGAASAAGPSPARDRRA